MQLNHNESTDGMDPVTSTGTAIPENELPMSSAEAKRLRRREYNRAYAKRHKDDIRTKANRRFNERYANDPIFREAYKARKAALQRKRAVRNRETTRLWAQRNVEHREDYRLRYEYGISSAQYRQILEAQGGVCLLCGRPATDKRLSVDHDHCTGIVRGLMHRSCNATLCGVFGDDPTAMIRAAERFIVIGKRIAAILAGKIEEAVA